MKCDNIYKPSKTRKNGKVARHRVLEASESTCNSSSTAWPRRWRRYAPSKHQ